MMCFNWPCLCSLLRALCSEFCVLSYVFCALCSAGWCLQLVEMLVLAQAHSLFNVRLPSPALDFMLAQSTAAANIRKSSNFTSPISASTSTAFAWWQLGTSPRRVLLARPVCDLPHLLPLQQTIPAHHLWYEGGAFQLLPFPLLLICSSSPFPHQCA